MSNTVGQLFLDAVARHGENPLFISIDGPPLSYFDCAVRVNAIVTKLREYGIAPGEYVCCYTEEAVELGLFILACSLVGAHATPVSPLFSESYLVQGVAAPLGARAVLASRPGAFTEKGLHVFCYDRAPQESSASSTTHLEPDTIIDSATALSLLHDTKVDREVFVVQLTSGTTRKPRLVPRKHEACLRYARYLSEQLVPRSCTRHRFLLVETFNHAFALHMFTTAIHMGGALCVTSGLSSSASLAEVRALKPTVLPILPRVQRAMHRQHLLQSETEALGSMFGPEVEYVCSAGGPACKEILQPLLATGLRVIEFYGSTEASIIACTPAGDWRPPYCGKLVDDVEARFASDGELLLRSPGLMDGYLNAEEETREAMTDDGFYRTGDIVQTGKDGYVRVLGRKHDFFGTFEGSAVFPAYIEQLIEGYSWVRQTILVGAGLPFMTALIVFSGEPQFATGEAPRVLPPAQYATVYEKAGRDLASVNAQLEKIEQIVRFALFAVPFSDDIYTAVGPGKIRRSRPLVSKAFADVIAWLYAEEPNPEDQPSFVPGAERRLRPLRQSWIRPPSSRTKPRSDVPTGGKGSK
ncbi:MAG: AMP-dependent synthetase/ligase [Polyangiales bacterium]